MLARCWHRVKRSPEHGVNPAFTLLPRRISGTWLRSSVTEYRASYRAILDQATPGMLFAVGSKSAEHVGGVLA